MATAVECKTPVKLPEIQTKSIYDGRFKDRSKHIRPAGKLTSSGDTAHACMTTADRPDSPSVVKKFRATYRPDAGQSRVFYGKAYDPQQKWAKKMTHGVSTQPSLVSGDLVNPSPNSLFRQKLFDKKESHYSSHQRAPLGRSHDQTTGLKKGLDPDRFTFGIQTEKSGSSGELINPNKSRVDVDEDYEKGRDLYRRTHFDYRVGEQCNRNYFQPNFDESARFGIPTPHHNDGRHVKHTMHWLHEQRCDREAPLVAKRVDDFRERTQPQLGKVHDPIKDTLNVEQDHTFGIIIKPDAYGAGDLIHGRSPSEYLRGRDRMRGLVAAMRQHLKKANYHNFIDLMAAFRHYDKDRKGKIDLEKLREVCIQFNLPVEPELLEQVFDYCDANRDGQIDYVEFSNFLNWKDKMPNKLPGRDVNSAPGGADTTVTGGHPTTPSTLQKQIDTAIGDHRTSSSMVNAIVGGLSTRDYRKYGVPTIRTDLPAPRIRRVDDRTNYGDESDAFGLVNPSLYSTHGVYEKDFLLPRTKEELKEIFTNIGVQMDYETFEKVFDMASVSHPAGKVSVESFRNVMDDAQAMALKQSPV